MVKLKSTLVGLAPIAIALIIAVLATFVAGAAGGRFHQPRPKTPDLVLGIVLLYADGDMANAYAYIAGTMDSMAECRKLAAEAMAKPHDAAIAKVACAALEIQ